VRLGPLQREGGALDLCLPSVVPGCPRPRPTIFGWTWRRWLHEYVRAYLDLLYIAERWIPPLGWHCEFYRQCAALRVDSGALSF